MGCPKCKAKVGVMKHDVMLDTGVVQCTRCVICGYWSQPYPLCQPKYEIGRNQAVV